jgi:hypothetical protein
MIKKSKVDVYCVFTKPYYKPKDVVNGKVILEKFKVQDVNVLIGRAGFKGGPGSIHLTVRERVDSKIHEYQRLGKMIEKIIVEILSKIDKDNLKNVLTIVPAKSKSQVELLKSKKH